MKIEKKNIFLFKNGSNITCCNFLNFLTRAFVDINKDAGSISYKYAF